MEIIDFPADKKSSNESGVANGGRAYWEGSENGETPSGMKQLPNRGDILFLTGGEKDVMSLTARGFYALCFNSETSLIPFNVVAITVFAYLDIDSLFGVELV